MLPAALGSIINQLLEHAAAVGVVLTRLQEQLGLKLSMVTEHLLSGTSRFEAGISRGRILSTVTVGQGIDWLQADGQLLYLFFLSGVVLFSLWPLFHVVRALRIWIRAIRQQAKKNLMQAGESLAARHIPPRQALVNLLAFLHEYTGQFLDWIWAYLQPHPYLYDREQIRAMAGNLYREAAGRLAPSAGWFRNLSPTTASVGSLADIAAEATGKNLPPELIKAIGEHRQNPEDLPKQWLDEFDRVFEKWIHGQTPGFLICGNSGSGKSTLLTVLEQKLKLPVQRVAPVQRPHQVESAWLDELCALSADEIEGMDPHAVIVDNLEMFFLRQPGGFDEIKKLLRSIHATSSKIFWLLSCGSPLWDYLSTILPLDQLLPEQLKLEALDAAWLADNYSKRLQTAGFMMRIFPSRQLLKQIRNLKRRHAIRENEIADYIKQQYFAGLLEQGGLNFAFFNQQLLQSISAISGRVLRIDPADTAVGNQVGELSLEAAFCLQNLFIHRSMRADELAAVLRQPLLDIELQLAALRARNLVVLEAGSYSVQPLLFRSLYVALGKKNLFSERST